MDIKTNIQHKQEQIEEIQALQANIKEVFDQMHGIALQMQKERNEIFAAIEGLPQSQVTNSTTISRQVKRIGSYFTKLGARPAFAYSLITTACFGLINLV